MKPGASFLQRRLDPPCLHGCAYAHSPRKRILRISVGIPDICEFRAIAFACECAGEKGPTRERRDAKSANHWLCRSFARILLQTSKNHGFCAILWICLPNFAPPQTLRLQLLSWIHQNFTTYVRIQYCADMSSVTQLQYCLHQLLLTTWITNIIYT